MRKFKLTITTLEVRHSLYIETPTSFDAVMAGLDMFGGLCSISVVPA
jgi:hypothetical protein